MDAFRRVINSSKTSKIQEERSNYKLQEAKEKFHQRKIWLSFSDFQFIVRAGEFLTISTQISV